MISVRILITFSAAFFCVAAYSQDSAKSSVNADAGSSANQVVEEVDVETVDILPGPTSSEQQEAAARLEQQKAAIKQLQSKNVHAEKSRKQKRDQAQKALKAAEEKLKLIEEVRAEDRQGIAGGGSRLTEDYYKRVKAAEAAVETAKENLRKSR